MNLLFLQAPGGGDMMGFLLMMGAMFVVLYFLMIRPQQKRQKELQKMINNLKTGDRVLTGSGMFGVIRAMDDSTVTVEIANNTNVIFQKAAIVGLADTIKK